MVALLLLSCQKDVPDVVNSLSDEADVTTRVKAFFDKATADEFSRSDEEFSVDSTEWYLEAAANYGFAEAWLQFPDERVDSLEFQLELNSSTHSATQLQQVFTQIQSLVITSLADAPEEHLVLADVKTSIEANRVTYTVYFYFGSGIMPKILNSTFAPTAYYRAMMEDVYPNNCGCGSNSAGSGPCAAKQIQNRLNAAIPHLGVGQFYTDIDTYNASGAPNFWYCTSNCYEVCLAPSQLSSLTNSAWNVFGYSTPSGKKKISVTMFSTGMLCCPDAFHLADFKFGKLRSGVLGG